MVAETIALATETAVSAAKTIVPAAKILVSATELLKPSFEGVKCSTTVIRKACARFPGFVLRAVTPFPGDPALCLQKCLFFENSAPDRKIARNPDENVAGGHFSGPRKFSGFFDFSTSPT